MSPYKTRVFLYVFFKEVYQRTRVYRKWREVLCCMFFLYIYTLVPSETFVCMVIAVEVCLFEHKQKDAFFEFINVEL